MGVEQEYNSRTSAGHLNQIKLKQLKEIGCIPKTLHYHKGIAGFKLILNGRKTPIDIVNIKNYIDKQIINLEYKAHANALHHLTSYLTAAAWESKGKTYNASTCIQERNLILARIGLLALPKTFITTLQSPVAFIHEVAPHLGSYVLSGT